MRMPTVLQLKDRRLAVVPLELRMVATDLPSSVLPLSPLLYPVKQMTAVGGGCR